MRIKLFFALLALCFFCSCGARMEATAIPDPHVLLSGRYQLLVQSDSPTLDALVYDSAWRSLKPPLPLAEGGEFTGSVEVTFTSSTGQAPVAIGGASGRQSGGWYSGHSSGVQVGLSAAGALTWQKSLMTVTVKDASGERLWSASVKRRGGLSFGNSGDAAGARAAEACLEKIADSLNITVGVTPASK